MTMPIRRLGGALSIAVLSIGIAACGGSTPSVTTTAAPPVQVTAAPASVAPSEEASPSAAASAGVPGASLATTGRIEVVDKGFALTLPAGWTRVDLSGADLDKMMEAAGIADPALAQQYSAQIKSLMATGAMIAFGPDPSAGTQVTVLALPSMGMSLDLLEQVNTPAAQNLANGDVQTERITLPAGDAIHYRFKIDAAGTVGATLDQYLVLAGSKQMVIAATNATEADALAIATSIELLD